MSMVALFAMLLSPCVDRQPELCNQLGSKGVLRAARFGSNHDLPAPGNSAFMLMLIVGAIARRIEAKHALSSNETETLCI